MRQKIINYLLTKQWFISIVRQRLLTLTLIQKTYREYNIHVEIHNDVDSKRCGNMIVYMFFVDAFNSKNEHIDTWDNNKRYTNYNECLLDALITCRVAYFNVV